jgi:hypothetical protein
MVVGVIGLAGPLFDDEPLRIAGVSGKSSVDVVFFIAPAGESTFPVVKRLSSHITGERFTVAPLQRLQQRVGFLRGGMLDRLL